MCIYIFNGHFIIKIFIHNQSLSQKSTGQNSFLIAKEGGGREGSSRAGTRRGLLLLPCPTTHRGEEHHCAALAQATAAASSRHSISPKKCLPPLPRVWLQNCCCQDHHLSNSPSPDTSKMGLELASSDASCESPRSLHFLLFQMFVISTKPRFWSTFVFTRCYFILGLKIFTNFFPLEDFPCFFSVENMLLVGIV